MKELLEQLEEHERVLKDTLTPFVCALFKRFYENRNLWHPAIQVICELDCLQSLAYASNQCTDKICRPIVVKDLDEDKKLIRKPFLELVNMTHPGVKLKS